MNRDEYYLAVQRNSKELQHAWLRKGAEAKNHKYYARVELPRKAGSKSSNYRYFYSKNEYDAYKKTQGPNDGREPIDIGTRGLENNLEKNGYTKVSDNYYAPSDRNVNVATPKGASSKDRYVMDKKTGVVGAQKFKGENKEHPGWMEYKISGAGYVRNDQLDNPNSDYNLYIAEQNAKVNKYVKQYVENQKGSEKGVYNGDLDGEKAYHALLNLQGLTYVNTYPKENLKNLYKAYAAKYKKDNTIPKKIAKTVAKIVFDTKTKVSDLIDAMKEK